MIAQGSPRPAGFVAELDGQRYHVATPAQAGEIGGGARAWQVQRVTDQPADLQEFALALMDFSGGSGFSFEGLPGTYDWADGWDTASPGKPATWPRRATGAPFTTVDYKGWLAFHGSYFYAMRGRYCAKYAIDDTAGATWAIKELHDFGSGRVVAGRPADFKNRLYVPLRDGAGGSLAVFHELTTVAATTAEQQTIAISGTPTAGTYTVTFDGKTTAAIAFDAVSATLQAALRLIAGLEAVTVSSTGTVPNFTHTVVMTGVAGALGTSSPPQMTSTDSTTGGTHAIGHATTVAGVTDTWTAGPATRETRCFVAWQNKLVRANANTVSTVSGDPMTAGDWGATSDVGNSGYEITDLGVYPNGLLMLGKTNGLWTFDESLSANNETPDLEEVVDPQNCVGMRYSNGYMLVPHKQGTIRWRPGGWEFVGPEQEGALEGDVSRGWGRVAMFAPFGKQAFFAINDRYHASAAIGSFLPGKSERQPLVPHMHHGAADAMFEAVAILSNANEPASAKTPDTITDDSAVGTIAWTNPANAGVSDGAYATAAAGTSHYLKALNPQPNIPSGATIVGVVVTIERSNTL